MINDNSSGTVSQINLAQTGMNDSMQKQHKENCLSTSMMQRNFFGAKELPCTVGHGNLSKNSHNATLATIPRNIHAKIVLISLTGNSEIGPDVLWDTLFR